jgi:hypothetical protein
MANGRNRGDVATKGPPPTTKNQKINTMHDGKVRRLVAPSAP